METTCDLIFNLYKIVKGARKISWFSVNIISNLKATIFVWKLNSLSKNIRCLNTESIHVIASFGVEDFKSPTVWLRYKVPAFCGRSEVKTADRNSFKNPAENWDLILMWDNWDMQLQQKTMGPSETVDPGSRATRDIRIAYFKACNWSISRILNSDWLKLSLYFPKALKKQLVRGRLGSTHKN